jgi:hypothetical protein
MTQREQNDYGYFQPETFVPQEHFRRFKYDIKMQKKRPCFQGLDFAVQCCSSPAQVSTPIIRSSPMELRNIVLPPRIAWLI